MWLRFFAFKKGDKEESMGKFIKLTYTVKKLKDIEEKEIKVDTNEEETKDATKEPEFVEEERTIYVRKDMIATVCPQDDGTAAIGFITGFTCKVKETVEVIFKALE